MKRTRILVFLLLMLLPACAVKEVHRYRDARDTVRLLQAPDGSGSGIVIAPGIILTAAHVAEHIESGLTLQPGNKPLRILRVDEDLDLALLGAEVDCPCASVTSIPPMLDDPVVVIGYPLHRALQSQVVTHGEFQGVIGDRMLLTAPVSMGSSGGGVFVIHNGQFHLAGVLVGVAMQDASAMFPLRTPANHLSLAVHAGAVRGFLR